MLTRPPWAQYFMNIAYAVSKRGSCPRKQVGAIIIDREYRIIGTGYNGAPRGIPDCLESGCDLRMIDGRESCVRTLHAESNALDFRHRNSDPWMIFTTAIPCRLCAQRIIQADIEVVVFDEFYESQGTQDTKALFDEALIKLVPLTEAKF